MAGSSAADPGFRADLADATGRRVGLPGGRDTEYSARGAALLAALAVDGDVPAAPSAAGWRGREPAPPVAEPDPSRAAVWYGPWASYERARRAVTRYYHAGTLGRLE